jgi:iron(III) transport system permease protein
MISRSLFRKHAGSLFLLIPTLGVLFCFVIFPNVQIVAQSFLSSGRFGFDNYSAFFSGASAASMQALWGSVYVSLLTVVFSALIGVPLAYLFVRFDFPGKRLFSAVAITPIVMPPLVGVLAFLFLFGDSGILPRLLQKLFSLDHAPFALNGVWAIIVVHVYSLYVYFYLFASNFFRDLDVSILEAAENLGAGRLFTFRKVILPMMSPALGGAALLVFMISMASFSAPFIFAGSFRILSLEIYHTKLNGNMDLAMAQAVVLAVISILFLVLLRFYSNRRTYTGGSKGVQIKARQVRKGWLRVVLGAFGIALITLLILPNLTVVLMSMVRNGTWTTQIFPDTYTVENYSNLFRDPRVAEPVLSSLKMAVLATAGNLLFGVAAAYLIVRRKIWGGRLIEALAMLPFAVPGTVIAISLIVAFNQPRLITGGTILVGTFWMLPLAYFIRNLPLVFRSTYAAFEQFEPALEEAGRNLGASWWFSFRKIILPLIAPGVISGALLAFVLALGEFVSSILLYNYSNRPISVEIVSQLRVFNLGSAAAYSVFLILLIALTVFVSQRLLPGRSGRIVV